MLSFAFKPILSAALPDATSLMVKGVLKVQKDFLLVELESNFLMVPAGMAIVVGNPSRSTSTVFASDNINCVILASKRSDTTPPTLIILSPFLKPIAFASSLASIPYFTWLVDK